MIGILKGIGSGTAFGLAVLVSAAFAAAADAKTPPSGENLIKALSEAGKPGPEHKKLEPLVGKWTYTCKFWMDPSQPPTESKGTIERKLILGGRFLEEKVAGTGFDGKPGFEGLGLIGYDNAKKRYTSSWVSSMCTGTCSGVGDSPTSGEFTFETEAFCPVQKKTIKGREELRFEGENKTVAESYVIEDGKELKIMEIVAVRKK